MPLLIVVLLWSKKQSKHGQEDSFLLSVPVFHSFHNLAESKSGCKKGKLACINVVWSFSLSSYISNLSYVIILLLTVIPMSVYVQSYVVYLGRQSYASEPSTTDLDRVTDAHHELLGSCMKRWCSAENFRSVIHGVFGCSNTDD